MFNAICHKNYHQLVRTKIYQEGFYFFCCETRGFKNFVTTYDKSWQLEFESALANYASRSHGQIKG